MKRVIVITLAASLSFPSLLSGFVAQAQTLRQLRTETNVRLPKLAPDLEVLLADDDEEQRQAITGKTLAEARQVRRVGARQRAQTEGEEAPQRQRIGGLLLPSAEVLAEEKQSFIVQTDSGTPSVVLREKIARLGGTIRQSSVSAGLLTIEAPRNVIRQLAADRGVAYVSPDRPVAATGHLTKTTGTDQIRNLISSTTPLTGKGIGVAVLDSSWSVYHSSIAQGIPVGRGKDFIGNLGEILPGISSNVWWQDNYGHGTHVATLIAGNYNVNFGYNAAGPYLGVAPEVNLLGLRVLDDNGAGSASAVIAALDWCVNNRAAHNIRVINMSLGTMAKDSYKTDPLCLAARRAVNAGIVVVASAGNNGKNAAGQKIYGAINSPGIDPSVITVGAANTFGTDARSDDQVTSFSSRGPTRGYTAINGVRKYDNLIKPDLIAPGNKLIGAMSGDVALNNPRNKLAQQYGALVVTDTLASDWNGTNCRQCTYGTMYLSGTSMATPVVAGAVALMLQANPNLTPSLVKAILMYSAQPLKGFNMLEQGAGLLNVDGAARLATAVRTNLSGLTNGAALLNANVGRTIADGVYEISNLNSGKCLDVSYASTSDGAAVIQWGCSGASNQRWIVQHLGAGEYRITAQHSGKALDVSGASQSDGAKIHQWSWLNASNQRWRIRPAGASWELIAVHSGKSLDVNNGSMADGVQLEQYTTWLIPNQLFNLRSVGATSSLSAGLPVPQSTIADQSINWGQGVITNYGFLTGSNLMTRWQSVYGSGQILGDATTVANNTFSLVSGRTSGATLKAGAVNITSSGQILGDGIIIGDAVMLANGQILGDGIAFADGQILGDGTLLADGTTRSNTTLKNSSAFLGDNTSAMKPAQ